MPVSGTIHRLEPRRPSESTMPNPRDSLANPQLSVVIPLWNGEHNLGKLLPRLNAVLASEVGPATEVVVALPKDDLVAGLVDRKDGRTATVDFTGYADALHTTLF